MAIEPRYPLRTRPYDESREVYARPTGKIPPYGPVAAGTAAENTPLGRRRRRPSDTVKQHIEASPPQSYGAALARLVPPPGGRRTSDQVPRGATINAIERRTHDDRDTFGGGGFDVSGTGGIDDVKNVGVGRRREDSDGALGDRYYPFVHGHSRPHHHSVRSSSTTWHDPRGSLNETSSTTTFPPELDRQLLLAAAAAASSADAGPSRTISDHRDCHGWQRVALAGSGAEAGGDNNSEQETGGEVWEWNGRRVVLQTSRGRRQVGIQEQITIEGREESE